MTVTSVLVVISLLLASAAGGTAVWALRELALTAKSVRGFAEETRTHLIPLLEKADVTVDAANVELLRIDAAITRFEDVSVRVGEATGTLSDIVQAPAGVVGEVADRVRRAWKHRAHRVKDTVGTPQSPEQVEPDSSAASSS